MNGIGRIIFAPKFVTVMSQHQNHIYLIVFFQIFLVKTQLFTSKFGTKLSFFPDQTGADLVGVTAAALVLAGAAIADWLKKWRRQRRSGDFQPIRDKPLR